MSNAYLATAVAPIRDRLPEHLNVQLSDATLAAMADAPLIGAALALCLPDAAVLVDADGRAATDAQIELVTAALAS